MLAPGLLLAAVARSPEDGFTLIELLVVVGVIGILAAIAIPTFGGYRSRSYDARVMADARNAATGEEAYFNDAQAYYSGDCSGLPGVTVSGGVRCRARAVGTSYRIRTRHALATKRCTWSPVTVPNLICS
jgi:type IV pilus assembly protein PilA